MERENMIGTEKKSTLCFRTTPMMNGHASKEARRKIRIWVKISIEAEAERVSYRLKHMRGQHPANCLRDPSLLFSPKGCPEAGRTNQYRACTRSKRRSTPSGSEMAEESEGPQYAKQN